MYELKKQFAIKSYYDNRSYIVKKGPENLYLHRDLTVSISCVKNPKLEHNFITDGWFKTREEAQETLDKYNKQFEFKPNWIDKFRNEQQLATRIYYIYDEYNTTHGFALDKNGDIHYARAILHPGDQFNKKLGRIKVEGRLLGRAKKHYFKFSSLNEMFDWAIDSDINENEASLTLDDNYELVSRLYSLAIKQLEYYHNGRRFEHKDFEETPSQKQEVD